MIAWRITLTRTHPRPPEVRTISAESFADAGTLADYLGDMAPTLSRDNAQRAAERLQLWKFAPEMVGNFTAEKIEEAAE